jgi:Zn-dependent M16 (insulinase) family peptidase
MTAASAGISPAASLAHQWEGLQGLRDLKILDDALDENSAKLEAFAADLTRLHEQLQRAPRRVLVVSEAEQITDITESLSNELPVYPEVNAAQTSFISTPVHHLVRQGWSVNSQVNFCAKAYPTVPQRHPDAPALQVLGNFLRNGFLHRAVREQGGAYGAGANYDADTGAFRFFSYRDPRLEETLADFDRALAWLRTTRHEHRALEEAILGVIAAIDRPASPAGEAIATYFGSLFGRSPEQRREFRRRALEVTLEDLDRVASKYLVTEQGSVAILSDKAKLANQTEMEVTTI